MAAPKAASKRGGKVNLRPTAKKTPAPRSIKMADTKIMGLEPEVNGFVFKENDPRLTSCYNWYNYFYGVSDAKKWAIEHYFKTDPEVVKKLSKVPEPVFSTTVGWICCMIDRGAEMPQKTLLWKANKVREMTTRIQEVKEIKAKAEAETGPSWKAPSYNTDIESFELMLDQFMLGGYKDPFIAYDYFSKNDTKKLTAIAVADYYRPLLEEIKEVVAWSNPGIKEAYSHLNKKQRDTYLKQVATLIDDCERWSANKTKVSKVIRAPKKKSNDQLLKGFKFKKDNPALKLVSIDPSSIIGATMLIAYNDKYRKVMIFNASDGQTLSVKGASLTGYDETKSESKTLRKPELQLQSFSTGTITSMKKRFDEITSKPSVPTGRISTDVLLLKVFK